MRLLIKCDVADRNKVVSAFEDIKVLPKNSRLEKCDIQHDKVPLMIGGTMPLLNPR